MENTHYNLTNNTLLNNEYGIGLYELSNSRIINNRVSSWGRGFLFDSLMNTDVFDNKMSTLSNFKSQIGDPMEDEFVKYATTMAEKAAEGQSYKLGEAFHRLEVLQRL